MQALEQNYTENGKARGVKSFFVDQFTKGMRFLLIIALCGIWYNKRETTEHDVSLHILGGLSS